MTGEQLSEFIDGFVKTCSDLGMTTADEMFELFKKAMMSHEVKKVQDKDKQYEQLGKKIKGVASSDKVERDAFGLSGEPGRTNVNDVMQYQM